MTVIILAVFRDSPARYLEEAAPAKPVGCQGEQQVKQAVCQAHRALPAECPALQSALPVKCREAQQAMPVEYQRVY